MYRKRGKKNFRGRRNRGKYARKRFGKGRGRKNKGTISRFGTYVTPDRVLVKMRYTETFDRVPGGPADEYVFRGNGPFDPNVTGVGAQPTGYDQWSNLYLKYRVHGSKISVLFMNASSTNNSYCSIIPCLTNTGVSTIADAISTPYSRWGVLPIITGFGKLRLHKYMSTSKMFGQVIRYEDNFESLTTTLPNNQWYWIINVSNLNVSNNVVYQMIVTIEYFTEFFQRVPIDES